MANVEKENNKAFIKKVWITGSIFSLIIIILFLLKATFSVILLILAGVLIAVFFRGFGDLIERKLKLNETVSLIISVVFTFLLVAGILWLIGSKLQAQMVQLSETLPASIQTAKEKLNNSSLGQKLVRDLSSPGMQAKAKTVASTFFKTTFGILGDVYVVIFLGIFLTVSPKLYKNGIVKLVPTNGQDKANEVLKELASSLKKWLKGKLFAMFVVFVLTAIGLVIIGVPMWLALAIMAGILNFIPNFGPLIAMIPAVLVALMESPATAGFVAGLYILVQFAESNFITPMVQQKLVNIPPALIIISQLIMGTLTGGWGLILATPLMLIVIVLVQQLYINEQPDNKNS